MDAHPYAVDENLSGVGNDGGRDLFQVLHGPLLKKLQDGRRGRPHRHQRHQREVLHEAARLPLGSLRRTHHAPVGVVQLSWFGQLALAPNGGIEAAEVGQGGCEGEAVEHLRHPRPDVLCPLRSPVASRQGVLQPGRDRLGFHRQRELDVLAAVDAPLGVQPHILGQLPEQLAEQHADERARHVHPLVSKVIAVVLAPPPHGAQQQAVHDVPQVIRLFGLAVLVHSHVRQQLLLQDLLCVLDALVPRHTHRAAALPNEIQRHRLGLNDKCLLNGRPQQLHHLVVPEVVHDMLQDVLICHEAQRAEHHKHGDVCADVR
mmetsp:Transcript_29662/g.73493  ORF Transcript_29662/g.73493 Transcript_29662/m.73493 type:complete len:317 (-) Transcript_29662:989-1939(-)